MNQNYDYPEKVPIMLQPLYPNTNQYKPIDGIRGIEGNVNILSVSSDISKQDGCYKRYREKAGNFITNLCTIFSSCGIGPIIEIEQGHVGLVSTFGVYDRKLGPGLYTFNICTEKIKIIDMRAQILDIPPQSLLTSDFVTIQMDSYVNYQIDVPELAQYNCKDYE